MFNVLPSFIILKKEKNLMSEIKLKLSPPWITGVNYIKALFGADPDINITYDNDKVEVKLFVNNADKADAISQLLPTERWFGNVVLTITVVPGNNEYKRFATNKELFDTAFDRNPVYAYCKEVQSILSDRITYVVFKNKVVQFFNDNLNDIHGLISILYEDIADELFEDANLYGVFYNTDIEEMVGMPLGEWP